MRFRERQRCSERQSGLIFDALCANPMCRVVDDRTVEVRGRLVTMRFHADGATVEARTRPRLGRWFEYVRHRETLRRRAMDVLRLWTVAYVDYPRKVFGIGFPRTGTKTLARALSELGLLTLHYAPWLASDVAARVDPSTTIARYTALTDSPFPLIYKEVDRTYPESKFVLTIREIDRWLPSIRWLGGDRVPAFRKMYYGIEGFDERVYRERYLAHNRDVKEYFRNRPDDLLVVDWEKGHGYRELCDFLGVPVPAKEFPWLNRRAGGGSST